MRAAKKVISNEHRVKSFSLAGISREINQARGYDMNPCDLLMRLEERGGTLYEAFAIAGTTTEEDEYFFIRSYVRKCIDNI